MDSIRHAIYMIQPGMLLASLDIKGFFYSIPIHKTFLNGFKEAMWVNNKSTKITIFTLQVLCYIQFLKNTKFVRIVLNHF